jgi:hypothetical protein
VGDLARLFLRLGTTSFGGPAAHIAMMRDEVVVRRSWLSDRDFLALGVVAAATLLMVGFAAPKWVSLAGNGFGATQGGRDALRAETTPAYEHGDRLRDEITVPGDAFVFADPVVLLQTGRDQGVPTNGWSPEQLDRGHWARLGRELEREQPPLVVIEPASLELMAERAPATLAVIDDGWCQVGGVDGERWYLRRELGECPA